MEKEQKREKKRTTYEYKDKVVQKLSQNSCTNIISPSEISL